MYGFTGGGLPPSVRTIFIEPFEVDANASAAGGISADVQREMQASLVRSLSVRLAGRERADAVVRGRITGYDESSMDPRPGANGRVEVTKSQVRISFDAEIYDVKQDRPLWRGSGLAGVGTYNPGSVQSVEAARAEAIRQIVQKVIDGAQSQW